MISLNYQNNTYVNCEYILTNAPVYSKGCRSSRNLISKKNIDITKYFFAREKTMNGQ